MPFAVKPFSIKRFWFQLHWLFGISAGLVLALMGATGAALSFEHEIIAALNPAQSRVQVLGRALSPEQLVEKARAAYPGKAVVGLRLSSEPGDAAEVGFAGGRRGEWLAFDPYSGTPLGKAETGTALMDFVEKLHRFLALGDVGKQITGASTLILLFMVASGLYLRWPKHAARWRSWLVLDRAKRGRAFLWELHAVAGSWVLIVYLLSALTGLYWSYDWYRDGLFALSGAPRPEQKPRPQPAKPGERPLTETLPSVSLAAVWRQFESEVVDWQQVTLRLPDKKGAPVELRYLPSDASHSRALDTLTLDPVSYRVRQHEHFAGQPLGTQLMRSMLALHTGEYFGLLGRLVLFLASLTLPLFAVTGWLLYLDRRRKQQAVRAVSTLSAPAPSRDVEPWLIAYASQSGTAQQLAWSTAGAMQAAGLPVTVRALAELDARALRLQRQVLFVVSTFGDGQAPDAAQGFVKRVLEGELDLAGLRYGLLALGDKTYQDFCGFGRRLHGWLQSQGAELLFAPVELDNGDPAGLESWQAKLGQLAGQSLAPLTTAPGFAPWRLIERRWLNPGSSGAPMFHLALAPVRGTAMWRSGDLVAVLPPAGETETETETETVRPRDYSIASVPEDGALWLLVRQERHVDGSLGLCSGWLTERLAVGDELALRIRSNPGFQLPDDDRPVILIGNGSGLSSLRAHLQARALRGHFRNWLIFGERQAAHDYYYQEEIEAWRASGQLERLSLAFSRDGADRRYVQDLLTQDGQTVNEWLADGASVYVCGSLQGMAGGVEAALLALLGDSGLQTLREQGRYCRDVY